MKGRSPRGAHDTRFVKWDPGRPKNGRLRAVNRCCNIAGFCNRSAQLMKIGYAGVSTGEQDTAAQRVRPNSVAGAAGLFGVHRATTTRLLQRKLAA